MPKQLTDFASLPEPLRIALEAVEEAFGTACAIQFFASRLPDKLTQRQAAHLATLANKLLHQSPLASEAVEAIEVQLYAAIGHEVTPYADLPCEGGETAWPCPDAPVIEKARYFAAIVWLFVLNIGVAEQRAIDAAAIQQHWLELRENLRAEQVGRRLVDHAAVLIMLKAEAARAAQAWKGDEQAQGIPAAERTKPMTLAEAGKHLRQSAGRKDRGKSVAKWVKRCIDDGTIAVERITRQSYVFSRTAFPKETWPKILPTRPQSP